MCQSCGVVMCIFSYQVPVSSNCEVELLSLLSLCKRSTNVLKILLNRFPLLFSFQKKKAAAAAPAAAAAASAAAAPAAAAAGKAAAPAAAAPAAAAGKAAAPAAAAGKAAAPAAAGAPAAGAKPAVPEVKKELTEAEAKLEEVIETIHIQTHERTPLQITATKYTPHCIHWQYANG